MKLLGLLATVSLLLLSAFRGGSAEQCGTQAGGALCPQGYCCSQYGWCGTTSGYCSGTNCQGQCWSSALTSLIPSDQFELMLKHRDDTGCPAHGFYTYNAFITAASFFPNFGATGDNATRKREIAAFLAQTSHETTGGWASAPDGPYAWGYCYKQELNPPQDYCSPSTQYPCATGKQYYGRGPIQLSWNYNYGPCGTAIGQDLLNNPDLVASDAVISFETALWFWMTPQSPKPSSHDVVTGNWSPTSADLAANRYPGYGVITNIINGGIECGQGLNESGEDRIGFYKRYCDILGVSYGDNLDCYNQTPFG